MASTNSWKWHYWVVQATQLSQAGCLQVVRESPSLVWGEGLGR